MNNIGLGGGCHWCTEAIFQSLKGVDRVDQGWISSIEATQFSEGIAVHFNDNIQLETLISIHLHTHSSTSNHSMRGKYRSAIYVFNEEQGLVANSSLKKVQQEFKKPIITQVLTFKSFELNKETYLDYYYRNREKPFCRNYITPKLKMLLKSFGKELDPKKTGHLA